jgi:hypothetical protein
MSLIDIFFDNKITILHSKQSHSGKTTYMNIVAEALEPGDTLSISYTKTLKKYYDSLPEDVEKERSNILDAVENAHLLCIDDVTNVFNIDDIFLESIQRHAKNSLRIWIATVTKRKPIIPLGNVLNRSKWIEMGHIKNEEIIPNASRIHSILFLEELKALYGELYKETGGKLTKYDDSFMDVKLEKHMPHLEKGMILMKLIKVGGDNIALFQPGPTPQHKMVYVNTFKYMELIKYLVESDISDIRSIIDFNKISQFIVVNNN